MNLGPKSVLSPRPSNRATPVRRTSILQSPFNKRTPMKGSISGRSNQSIQVICKSLNYVVENFGTPLPVLITEALTFTDSNTAVSVNISSEGWAWFVCGRRLLIWQAYGRRPINTQCRELTLPPSDLAHRAHLVTVYTTQSSQMPCCLAVSPEGMVRYWSSIAHESSWVESNADLHGQECDSLQLISPLGCLLVTTTATLVLVTPQVAAARHALVCRTIKAPHGWLGGIGRRMTSLIFGSIPTTQIMETKLVKVVTMGEGNIGCGEWNVMVLAGHSLQKWQLYTGDMERLVYEVDLGRPIREAFLDIQIEAQDLVLLDMQGTESGIMLLVAISSAQASSHIYYDALVTFATDSLLPPSQVSWFYQLRSQDLAPLLQSTLHDKTLQFLIMGQTVLIYNHTHIVAVPALSGSEEVELLEPGSGTILGGALCGRLPVFFTFSNGFISVSSSDIPAYDVNGSLTVDCTTVSEAGMSESQLEELSSQKDNVGLIRAAFLLYIRKNLAQSKAVVSDLCLTDTALSSKVDSVLDTVVVKVSKDLIDDVPVKDPRWADHKTTNINISSSNSLQIVNHLEEKQKVLEWYINFLKDLKLWDQLGAMTLRGKVMATPYILQEHVEKVVAAISLKKLHSDPKYSSLIDTYIEEVLACHKIKPFGGLTNQDLFYRQVSLVHEALHQLVKWSENVVYSEQSPQHISSQLLLSNHILLEVLNTVLEHRQRSSALYKLSNQSNNIVEYLPWTAASGPDAFRDSLITQMKLTLEQGIRGTGDPSVRAELLDHLVNLVDLILDGRKSQVESLRNTPRFNILLQQYEADRINFIQPFLLEEEYERAAMLAEKYLDFQILVELCDKTNNKQRLDHYTKKFKDQNFSQFLFNWYMRENKQSHLVERCHEKGGEQLASLLTEHPSLSWLNDIATGNYRKASDTLASLARNETQLLRRKKSMVSLAALTLLAANDEPNKDTAMEKLRSDLDLIANQEELPDVVLNAYGYDFDNLRVFTPAELIKLYICEENPSCTEFDLKKALDLLSYVEDDLQKAELKNEIWCRAITRDTWVDLDPNAPLVAVQHLLFFKLISLCMCLDSNLDLVPPLEQLSRADELGELKDNNTFQYLLRVGYEHIAQET